MMKLLPFAAVRPTIRHAHDVAAHAYDVVSREEGRLIALNNPLSFLKVEKSEINLPDDIEPPDPRVYRTAKDVFDSMMREGVLVRDVKPRFYLYRQRAGEHVQAGIVACFGVEDYRAGRIRRHELTRSDKELDRTIHIDVLNAQTGPVFLTFRDGGGILDAVIGDVIGGAEPECAFRADDDTWHDLWVIDDEAHILRLRGVFDAVETLYIADGHHRAAAAARVADLRREANPDHSGEEEYNRVMAVIFPHRQLQILPYNRVVSDLAGMDREAFLHKVSEQFQVDTSSGEVAPSSRGTFGMYLKGQWYRLSLQGPCGEEQDSAAFLDVSILQDRLITPVLGVSDVRTDERIDFVGGIRGTKELTRLVDSGSYAVAFSLYPTDLESLMSISDRGEIMPPKSTWFEPKLKSGLFVHVLD